MSINVAAGVVSLLAGFTVARIGYGGLAAAWLMIAVGVFCVVWWQWRGLTPTAATDGD
ncbi:MAG: hypothetical protein Q4A82_06180 [Corynebacterium sp.]|nr:hypothetical protein [Corynebacterium sp.]